MNDSEEMRELEKLSAGLAPKKKQLQNMQSDIHRINCAVCFHYRIGRTRDSQYAKQQ